MKFIVDLSKLPKLMNKAREIAKKVFETQVSFEIKNKGSRGED